MSDKVKSALIIAGGLIAAVLLYGYFSPYQSCVREMKAGGSPAPAALCAKMINSN